MNVYLDSVFNPLLREQDFLQEGWRLENDELEDKTSPLIIKGRKIICFKLIFSEIETYKCEIIYSRYLLKLYWKLIYLLICHFGFLDPDSDSYK